MTAPYEPTLAYWAEHRHQLRQSEAQRAVLTNFVLVMATALTGLIVQQGFKPGTLALSTLVSLIGAYGAAAVSKYHERAEYHLTQARALTRILVAKGDLDDHKVELDAARTSHYERYPLLHRVRLHILWTGLHLAIFVYGMALSIVTVSRWMW